MADPLVHVDSEIRDPHAYARAQYLEGLPFAAQARYRAYAEAKAEAEMLANFHREKAQELDQRLRFFQRNAAAARQSASSSATTYEKQEKAAQAECDANAAKRSR